MDGIIEVSVSLIDKTAFVTHRSNVLPDQIVDIINSKHLGASIKDTGAAGQSENIGTQSVVPTAIRICAIQIFFFAFGVVCMYALGECDEHCDDVFTEGALNGWEVTAAVLWSCCILFSYRLFYHAGLACLRLRPNMEVLMSIAIIGSVCLGDLMSASLVAVIVNALEAVTDCAMRFIDQRLKAIVTSRPELSALVTGGSIPVAEIKPGDDIVIRVGESVPVDGTVTKGEATVDESKVTGEAMPIIKQANDQVLAGAVVVQGFMHICASNSAAESFQGSVAEAVERAKRSGGSLVEQRMATIAKWYTPAVILLAAAVAAAELNFKKFLVILVAGCPCSLLGAAPLVYGTAIAMLASKHQLVVKGAHVVEALADVKVFGLDKTGTITNGEFELKSLEVFDGFEKDLVHRWAAVVENADSHPIARSIVKSYSGCLVVAAQQLDSVAKFMREGRAGVRGEVDGHRVGVGNAEFIDAEGVTLGGTASELLTRWEGEGTVVFVTVNRKLAGMMLLCDAVRPDAPATVKALHEISVATIMLTGDRSSAADVSAAAVGITAVHAQLLPHQKAEWLVRASHGLQQLDANGVAELEIESGLRADTEGGQGEAEGWGSDCVGFIGDGLNDCVALAKAHVGIAMQEVTSAAMLDSADAVLQGELGQLPAVIVFARRARLLVLVNVVLAVVMNLAIIVPSVFMDVPLWVGALCDNGGLLVVLLNSLWPLSWEVTCIDTSTKAMSGLLHRQNKLTYKQKEAIKARPVDE